MTTANVQPIPNTHGCIRSQELVLHCALTKPPSSTSSATSLECGAATRVREDKPLGPKATPTLTTMGRELGARPRPAPSTQRADVHMSPQGLSPLAQHLRLTGRSAQCHRRDLVLSTSTFDPRAEVDMSPQGFTPLDQHLRPRGRSAHCHRRGSNFSHAYARDAGGHPLDQHLRPNGPKCTVSPQGLQLFPSRHP